jgi:hypothetical protein
MRTIETGEDVRPLALLEALQVEDIPVVAVHPDGRVVLDVAEGDDTFDAQVATIVAAHDTAALDAAEAQERDRFLQDVAGLKAYQNLSAPTLAQTVAATKAQNRVLARIVAELREE